MAATFSTSGSHFAACDNRKRLAVWETAAGNGSWTCIGVRTLKRRCLSLTFTPAGDQVIVADKSGDAYFYSVQSPEEEGTLLLGHISMLLDVTVCGPSGDLVATADRDEKIRISRLPNAYNIHTYCLGHTEFVTRLKYLKELDILLSGAGDGTIRLWDYMNGQELHCTDCKATLALTESDTSASTPGQGEQETGETNTESRGREDGDAAEVHSDSDISRFAFDAKRSLLAVGFDRSPTVLIYRLQQDKSAQQDPASHNLSVVQRIDLMATLWDLTFDPEGNLWTLQAVEGGAVRVHRTSADGEQLAIFKPSDVGEDDRIQITAQTINNDWDEFKGCISIKNICGSLHRPKMHNAPMYFERKQKRIAEGGKRKANTDAPPVGDTQNQADSDATKKSKVDS